MAISPKMLAVLRKVEAAREEHFAKLRQRGKLEAEAKERAKLRQVTNLKKEPLAKTPPLPVAKKKRSAGG
jgi:hypothetical protein